MYRHISSWMRQPTVVTASVAWLVSRIVLFFLTIVGVVFNPNGSRAANHPGLTWHDLLKHWQFWDGFWYIRIAHNGYTQPSEHAYFPLYPYLIRLFAFGHYLLVGMIISNIALLVALIGLAYWSESRQVSPYWTIRLLLFAPFAFFFSAPYTESLFFTFVIWAWYAAERQRWKWVIVLGILAGLTRPTGILLSLPLLLLAWSARNHVIVWFAVASPIIGTGLYMLYSGILGGDPLAFVHSQTLFGKSNNAWNGLRLAGHQLITAPFLSYREIRLLVDFVPLMVTIILIVVCARYLPFADTVWCVSIVGVIILSPVTQSIFPDVYVSAGRYCLLTFPLLVPIVAAVREHAWLERLVTYGGIMLQMTFLVFLFRGGWLV